MQLGRVDAGEESSESRVVLDKVAVCFRGGRRVGTTAERCQEGLCSVTGTSEGGSEVG